MVRMGYRAWCARMNRKTRSGSPCSPARTRLPPLPGCRAPDAGDGSHVEGAPVPPAQRLSARQRACRHPARLAHWALRERQGGGLGGGFLPASPAAPRREEAFRAEFRREALDRIEGKLDTFLSMVKGGAK